MKGLNMVLVVRSAILHYHSAAQEWVLLVEENDASLLMMLSLLKVSKLPGKQPLECQSKKQPSSNSTPLESDFPPPPLHL